MLYQLFLPLPELADIVKCYWYVTIEKSVYSEQQYNTPLFDGLIFNFSKLKEAWHYEGKTIYISKTTYLFGQTKRRTVISGMHKDGGFIIGVRFKPLGLAKLTGISMHHLAGGYIEAEDIWGKEFKYLCEAMQEASTTRLSINELEKFLIKQRRAIHLHYRSKNVEQAIVLMKASHGSISCKDVHYQTNTCKKTLERAFVNFHGLKPKTYNSIIRFNAARRLIENGSKPNLTQLSYRLGYFDQSHFIKDFKRFSEQTPTEFLNIIEEERRKRTIPVD